jgi:nitrous oxidase accessory protein NosD
MSALCLLVCVSGCGSSDARGPAVIRVPGDASTIQQAVSAARPGDLVLIGPGTYRESVRITTPRITLRGTDRNDVIIDGEVRRANGIVVTAAEVSVENLTVRNHTLNGVLVTGMSDSAGGLARGSTGYTRLDPAAFPPLQGFRVSHVTSSNNALYGIYAFDAQHGVIEHNYASGSADSGIYVGQCKPCDIVVRDNVAERNAVGFEGANASGGLRVIANRFSGNRVGLTSNSDYQEAFVPQEDAVIVGNLITRNAEPVSPAQADGAFGIGIGIAGGNRNLVARNLITGNPATGIALGSVEDLPPVGNRIIGNVLRDNGFDVIYAASARAPGSANCLSGNELTVTSPVDLAALMPCPSSAGPSAGVPLPRTITPRGVPFREVPAGPRQPNLPGPLDALPAHLTVAADVDAIGVPAPDLLADRSGVH